MIILDFKAAHDFRLLWPWKSVTLALPEAHQVIDIGFVSSRGFCRVEITAPSGFMLSPWPSRDHRSTEDMRARIWSAITWVHRCLGKQAALGPGRVLVTVNGHHGDQDSGDTSRLARP